MISCILMTCGNICEFWYYFFTIEERTKKVITRWKLKLKPDVWSWRMSHGFYDLRCHNPEMRYDKRNDFWPYTLGYVQLSALISAVKVLNVRTTFVKSSAMTTSVTSKNCVSLRMSVKNHFFCHISFLGCDTLGHM